ncbi:Tn3 family transposase [Nocardiopsis dassonvillei]|uniref:Tn3 family transposase n=1 Tax=Nocardiopsis dassonvillei TaxID=2014 RepID=UPI00157C56B1|nr:Tn3 family transposase [Nocardiopsis dassonvillei]
MAVGDSSDLGNGALVGVRGRARFSELEWLRTEPDRVSESRHALARKICFGNRGELRQRYRQGLEDRLGAPGLVLNAVVGWNPLYIDAAVTRLRSGGFPATEEMCARLSPLGFDHINFLGSSTFPTDPAVEVLRPLRVLHVE